MAQDRADSPRIRWADLRTRVLSGIVLAPVALWVLWLGGSSWSVVVTAVAAGVACEWVGLCGAIVRAPPGIIVPFVVTLGGAVAADEATLAALLLLVVCALLLRVVVAARIVRRVNRPVSLAAGIVYVGIACVALIWLRQDPAVGWANVLFLIATVWASDVGAYMVGRLIGGPRLAPRISPGKTWAGAIGGLAAAVVAGFLVALLMSAGRTEGWRIVLVAALLAVVSQLGDLLESALKRHFGVKDSGRIIPGHGGLLDRLDGFLTAGPMAALLALALGPGVVLWG